MREKEKYYIDLFAGCGGLSLGLKNSGWKGLFAIEKNKDAFGTLKYNLIDNSNHFNWPSWLPVSSHDINNILDTYKEELLSLRGKVDLVAGGPPCQGFSMAGRRKEGDVRNKLVLSYIRFIDLVRPKILFFENVKGFTLSFKKNREEGIVYSNYVADELHKMGYDVHGELVNFGEYGVPQRRTRFILIGIQKSLVETKENRAVDFFSELSKSKELFLSSKNISVVTTLEQAISDLLRVHGEDQCPDSRSFKSGLYSNKTESSYQQLMRTGINRKQLIPDSHRFVNHTAKTITRFKEILEDKTIRRNKDLGKDIRSRYNIKKHTIIPLCSKSKAPTITSLPDDYIHYCEPRVLTVREYARIQSFPDTYEFKGKYTTGGKLRVKEIPRYTQIGNAIPPLFAEQVGGILKKIVS